MLEALSAWVRRNTREGRQPLLVAHNGHRFDFNLISRAIARCELPQPDEVWTLDSLGATPMPSASTPYKSRSQVG